MVCFSCENITVHIPVLVLLCLKQNNYIISLIYRAKTLKEHFSSLGYIGCLYSKL